VEWIPSPHLDRHEIHADIGAALMTAINEGMTFTLGIILDKTD
jgi:hypothetical protein